MNPSRARAHPSHARQHTTGRVNRLCVWFIVNCKSDNMALFSSKKFYKIGIVALSFVFDINIIQL